MSTHPSHIISAICLLLVGCAAPNQAGRSDGAAVDPAAERALRDTSAQWDWLYNAADAAALAGLYAEDAVSMPPGVPVLKGRGALREDFKGFFAANTARHETFIDQIVMSGDLAIERAHYRLTSKPKSGGTEVVETGRHLECRRKINGIWLIVLEIWNQDPPAK